MTLLSLSFQWLLLKVLTSYLISVEHHNICNVVFLDCIYLSLHGVSLICYTGPYHQCFHQKNSGLQFQLSCKVHNCKVSFKCCSHGRWYVPHRSIHRVNILEFLSRDKSFVLRNCCWEGRKKNPPFFIIPRCILICTSDIVSVMDYTKGNITAQQAWQGKKIGRYGED